MWAKARRPRSCGLGRASFSLNAAATGPGRQSTAMKSEPAARVLDSPSVQAVYLLGAVGERKRALGSAHTSRAVWAMMDVEREWRHSLRFLLQRLFYSCSRVSLRTRMASLA